MIGVTAVMMRVRAVPAATIPVLGVRDFSEQLRQAGRGPNATGLEFLVAVGVICLILGAGGLGVGAAAELRARADELRALRWQGASGWAVTRAGWQSYLAIVAAGVLAGGIASAVAWLAIGSSLPVVDTLVAGVPMPRWPGWTPVWAWVLATAVLCLVGAGLTVTLARATRSGPGRSRR